MTIKLSIKLNDDFMMSKIVLKSYLLAGLTFEMMFIIHPPIEKN